MPYQYRSPADDKPFQILSFGRDKKAGGSGNDADLVNN
jgi:general secretion pathway protein G